jgi:NAD+ synthase
VNEFNAIKVKQDAVYWIRDFFAENGPECNAIVGISGGKDSSTVAALCVEALGKSRVKGVLMPSGLQKDINYSREIVEYLGIASYEVNIEKIVDQFYAEIGSQARDIAGVRTNLPARVRMTVLYSFAAMLNGRVANTCNFSEDFVGYATKFGDGAGDFSPLSHLTVSEVKAIARVLGVPEKFVEKTPEDGLCGKSDEENLGFTYAVLDKYIREGVCEDSSIENKIKAMHKNNLHKLEPLPSFPYEPV